MYKKFMRHAKKITKDLSGSRPFLEGVLHKANGNLYATNSHVLYLGKGFNDNPPVEDVVITPTGRELEEKFPDVSRLLPDNTPGFRNTIKVHEYLQAMDIVNTAGRVSKEVTDIRFEGNTLSFKSEEIEVKYTLDEGIPADEAFTSNAAYWVNALQMFKNFGYKEVAFNYYGRLRPFTLVSPDWQLVVLITPMRSY